MARINTPATFLVGGEVPALTATAPSVVAPPEFELTLADTRPDDTRTGYALQLSASNFSAVDSEAEIPASNLTVVNVSGLPDG